MQPDVQSLAEESASLQAQEAINDRLQQVAAAAASVDPDTAADIAAEALPAHPAVTTTINKSGSFKSAFVPSQSTALPEQEELLLAANTKDQDLTADLQQDDRLEQEEERGVGQRDVVGSSADGLQDLEPSIASENVVAPTVSTGSRAGKGAASPETLHCNMTRKEDVVMAVCCLIGIPRIASICMWSTYTAADICQAASALARGALRSSVVLEMRQHTLTTPNLFTANTQGARLP